MTGMPFEPGHGLSLVQLRSDPRTPQCSWPLGLSIPLELRASEAKLELPDIFRRSNPIVGFHLTGSRH
jgi:hypothetical protein